MLARITRGLLLAEALQAKLARRVDRPDPVRTPYASREPSSPRKPRSPRTATQQPNTENSLLASLPTTEEIAEQLRTRPVHAVLHEICSNLGIMPSDTLWRDIVDVLTENHGQLPQALERRPRPHRHHQFHPAGHTDKPGDAVAAAETPSDIRRPGLHRPALNTPHRQSKQSRD